MPDRMPDQQPPQRDRPTPPRISQRMFETRSLAWKEVGLLRQISPRVVKRARLEALVLVPLFIGVVMFAPNGIAGLLMMHAPLWRAGAYGPLRRLALTYLIALMPALVMLAGLIGMIEMIYHRSVKASDGPTISLFHMTLDTTSALPWIAAIVAFHFLSKYSFPASSMAARTALSLSLPGSIRNVAL